MSSLPDGPGHPIEATAETQAEHSAVAFEALHGETPDITQIAATLPAELPKRTYQLRKTIRTSYEGRAATSPRPRLQRRMNYKALKTKLRTSITAEIPDDGELRTPDPNDDMDMEEGGYWTLGTISKWSGGISSRECSEFGAEDPDVEETSEANTLKPHDPVDAAKRAASPVLTQDLEASTHGKPGAPCIKTPSGRKYEYITVYQGHQHLATMRQMGTGRWIYKKSVDSTRPLVFYWQGSRLVGIYDRDTAGWLFEDSKFLAEKMKGSTSYMQLVRIAQGQDGFQSKVPYGAHIPRWPGQRPV